MSQARQLTVYQARLTAEFLLLYEYLAEQGLQPKVTIRLPLIPGYNSNGDRLSSRRQLEEMGFTDFDEFTYQLPTKA